MFCRNCGSALPENVAFCPNCGAKVEAAPSRQEAGAADQRGAGPRPQGQVNSQPRGIAPRPQPQNNSQQRPTGARPGQGAAKSGCSTRSLIIVLIMLAIAILLITLLVKGVFGLFRSISEAAWFDDYSDDYYYSSDYGDGYAFTPHQLSTLDNSNYNSSQTGSGYFGGLGDVTTGTSNGSGIVGTDLDLPSFRDNYTTIKGNGEDVYTLMIYIVGSDLETEDGAASRDLREIAAASSNSNLNIIVQTGGARRWWISGIGSGKVQRWSISNGRMTELEDLGRVNMASPDTLSSFISFCAENYPADRYSLIMWDHGGGSVNGYGWDEVYNDQHLDLSGIKQALSDAGVLFDFVGFDACLMSSIEVAYMLEPYADYLIASEETEPGSGWYYTTFVNALAANTSIDTVELGQIIIDSFARTVTKSDTLSLISLREIKYVYSTLCSYLANASAALQENYSTFSSAIASTVAFADGYYDMFDLVDITNNCDIEGENELVKAVESAVKYRNNCAVIGVYGMSCYVPYKHLSDYGTARAVMSSFGYGDEIFEFYDSFTSIMNMGQFSFGGFSLQNILTGARAHGNSSGAQQEF